MSNEAAKTPAVFRISELLDAGSFVEIGGAVTARNTDFNMQESKVPGDGVITGYGVIDGSLVYVYSQDASVLGGAVGEMHAKKITGLYDMAMKMGAPVIGLIDCAGLRLQEGTDALQAFGSIYAKQALASGVIPQITAVFGTCGGGAAILSGLSDFTFMEEKGKLFVNSPNAIPGNHIEKCDTSGAAFQTEEAGNVDFLGTESEILSGIRELICMLPANNEDNDSYEECTDDLNRLCAGIENGADDAALVLSMIADDQKFIEVKAGYAKEMVTGFVRMNGLTVGAVANRSKVYDEEGKVQQEFDGSLSAKGCRKAADFVTFCDAFEIPVLTLTDVNGFKASKCSEKTLAREAAKLVYAFTNATVPKVNVMTGKAIGSGYLVMNSKALGADMVYAWPDAEIGAMEAGLAAKIMYPDVSADERKEKEDQYRSMQESAASAAARGYVDTVIRPEDTRKYVIGAMEMLFTKREDRPSKKHGTV
ncbi:MAG: carboxyl transferase domain-containing protein [Sellimonas sp.]|nr:carboxyl transferase domain-containing protein [Sellimonas sp.]